MLCCVGGVRGKDDGCWRGVGGGGHASAYASDARHVCAGSVRASHGGRKAEGSATARKQSASARSGSPSDGTRTPSPAHPPSTPPPRSQQIEFGGECHISGRPYTVFRWKPGPNARYKKTIICQDVAKARNVCQVCLLDLKYGVPTQVRDAALGAARDELAAKSAVGIEYQLTQAARDGTLGAEYLEAGGGGGGAVAALPGTSALAALPAPGDGTTDAATPVAGGRAMLERLARRPHYYQRNAAKLCTFFAKGECKRGAACPYRHDLPSTGPLSNQKIKDRYYGVNDPVAAAVLAREVDRARIAPPGDTSITTLVVGGLSPLATEADVRTAFSAHGDLASVVLRPDRRAAFVTFVTRAGAEAAAGALAGRLAFHGEPAKLAWGKPVAGGALPAPGGPRSAYPSMDPSRAGATPAAAAPKRAAEEGEGGGGKKTRGE